jgi:hypothetical protein
MSTLTINEGFDKDTGIETKTHFDSDEAIVIQKTFDAEPHVEYAKRAREATEGQRWGEGKLVGHIPAAFHAELLMIRDPDERKRRVRLFFKENPAFVMYEPYLKDNRKV